MAGRSGSTTRVTRRGLAAATVMVVAGVLPGVVPRARAEVVMSMPAPPPPGGMTYRPAAGWVKTEPSGPDVGTVALNRYARARTWPSVTSPAWGWSGWGWGFRGFGCTTWSHAYYGGVPYTFRWPVGSHFRYPRHPRVWGWRGGWGWRGTWGRRPGRRHGRRF